MAALTKAPPFFLPFTALSFQQQETTQKYCCSNAWLIILFSEEAGNDIACLQLYTQCCRENELKAKIVSVEEQTSGPQAFQTGSFITTFLEVQFDT